MLPGIAAAAPNLSAAEAAKGVAAPTTFAAPLAWQMSQALWASCKALYTYVTRHVHIFT